MSKKNIYIIVNIRVCLMSDEAVHQLGLLFIFSSNKGMKLYY